MSRIHYIYEISVRAQIESPENVVTLKRRQIERLAISIG